MENASKALLFAAGILIAIILISVAVYIVSMGTNATDSVGQVMGDLETSTFNSKITNYEGRQTGSKVKSLLQIVNSVNKDATNTGVSIEISADSSVVTGSADGSYKFVGGNAKRYTVTIPDDGYTGGLVSKINIAVE